jgi:hypothetical protein
MKKGCFTVFLTLFFIGSNPLSTEGFGSDAKDLVLAKKTLNRWIDPVIVEGNLLSEVIDKPLSSLRLYAHNDGAFVPIRYQIDEMTQDGDWILAEGPHPNGELSNGNLDSQDKLIFMADDTGDRVSKDAWPSGYTKGSEIEVADPLTGEKGWCYLLYFESNPPPRSSLPDYIRYDYPTETLDSEYSHVEYIITPDGLHSTFYKYISGTEETGSNGKNYVDRLKCRSTIKFLFGSVTIKVTEETLKSDVLAYKQGPVRTIRRVEQYVDAPFGMKAMRVVVDNYYYRTGTTVPVMFDIPFRLDSIVTSAIVRFGTDYNPDAIGSKIYNSCNPQGFLVDGKMDDNKENFNPANDSWRLITGEAGTFMTRTIYTPEILNSGIEITMGLTDDIMRKDPPETYPGCIGYLWQDWNIGKLKKGKYWLFLEFYGIPHYKPGDEVKYMNYMDHPVEIRVGNKEGISQALLLPNLGDLYKKHHPKKLNKR